MAQAPTNEQTVFPEQGPLPNASGAAFGAQVGAAQQGVGQALNQAGDQEFDVAMKWQNLKNEATAQNLAVQFQGDLGKIEDGYYSLSGKAAADAYPKFSSDVAALQQKYLGASPNPMVANMVGGTVKFSVGRSLMSGGRYAGEQTKSWMIDSADGHAQMLAYQAAQKWDDPNFRETAFAGIDASAETLGEQKNWSADTTKLYAQKWKDESDKNALEARKKFIQSKPAWEVISALGGADASGGTQPTAANIDDIAATMRGKEGGPGGYTAKGGGAYQVHGGPVDENSTPAEQDAFFKSEFPKRMDQLATSLGHQVTQADGSLAWQQGVGGATALLKNPDENVISVLRPFYVTPKDPSGVAGATAAVTNNGGSPTETAAAFTQHVKGYYGLPDTAQATGQTTLTPSQMAQANSPGEDAQIKAAFDALPPDEQQAMRKSLLDSWHSQNAAFREQTRFDQEQAAKADAADVDKHVNAANGIIAANWADPTKNPALDMAKVVASDPWWTAHPEAITKVTNYRKNLDNKPDGGDAVTSQLYRQWLDGKATTKDFQDAFAPPDSSPGKISKANLDFLMNAAKGEGDDAQSQSTKALKAKFLSTAEEGIKGAPVDGSTGGDAQYRFDYDFQKAWDDKVKAGEDPRGLITPGNKDYFGSLANLSHYSQSAADQLAAEADKGNPGLLERLWTGLTGGTAEAAPEIPPDLPKGTVPAGKTKDGRPAFRLPDGKLVAVGALPATAGAPAPAPVAAAGPQVPTGE